MKDKIKDVLYFFGVALIVICGLILLVHQTHKVKARIEFCATEVKELSERLDEKIKELNGSLADVARRADAMNLALEDSEKELDQLEQEMLLEDTMEILGLKNKGKQ
jgi:uncharacterized protein Yka (UPF0111/DUF47 family)